MARGASFCIKPETPTLSLLILAYKDRDGQKRLALKRKTDRERERERDRQTETDRETDRQTESQKDSQIDRDRQILTEKGLLIIQKNVFSANLDDRKK